jgi:hypothetical protein
MRASETCVFGRRPLHPCTFLVRASKFFVGACKFSVRASMFFVRACSFLLQRCSRNVRRRMVFGGACILRVGHRVGTLRARPVPVRARRKTMHAWAPTKRHWLPAFDESTERVRVRSGGAGARYPRLGGPSCPAAIPADTYGSPVFFSTAAKRGSSRTESNIASHSSCGLVLSRWSA